MLRDVRKLNLRSRKSIEDAIIMENGAPPVFGIAVSEWLTAHFLENRSVVMVSMSDQPEVQT